MHQLLNAEYVTMVQNGDYRFTAKFYEDINKEVFDVPIQVVGPGALVVSGKVVDWQMQFMQLIIDAKVPKRLEDNRGNAYYANKYSEAGMKEFRKAIEKGGVQYPVLVKSTMLYYKSSVKYKKAIGNYFKDGDWRSDYNALLESSQAGETQLHDHIKEQTNASGHTGYQLG